MVEENGELYTIKLCESCCNMKQEEKKEPRVNGKQWRRVVGMPRPWREARRRRHACPTRFLSRNISERALPSASRLKNDRVSVDRPPTSTPSTTTLARLPQAVREGNVRSFRRRLASISACRISQCLNFREEGTDSKLDTPENGESIDNHFKTARVLHIRSSQIHVADHDVVGDSTPNVLRCESPSSSEPQHEHKLRGGGHWNRVEGHTGSCARSKGGEGEDNEGEGFGTSAVPNG